MIYNKYEKNYNKDHYSFIFSVFIVSLFSYMVNTFGMISPLKKIMVLTLWMSMVAGFVITIDSFFNIPDEVSGVAYFISIGIAASVTLNYYK